MKPSEAMRRGIAVTSSQAKELFYIKETDSCCAMGAMILGSLDVIPESREDRSREVENTISEDIFCTKMRSSYFEHYGTSIFRDNDIHGLTLEQIADRLEAIGL